MTSPQNISIQPSFPQSFQILPEWIEHTNDPFLLNLALPLSSSPHIKSLITSKLHLLSSPTDNAQFSTLSLTEKNTGNTFMQSGNIPEAIIHYTYSLIYNPNESTSYSNRALAYIKQSQFQKGVYDCTKAIDINKQYTKAFYRRSTCYSNLKKYRLALNDLLYLLNTGNGSKEIESEISNIILKFKSDVGNDNWSKMEGDVHKQISMAKQQKADINAPWEVSEELIAKFNNWKTSAHKVQNDIKNFITNQQFVQASDVVKTCYEHCMKFKEEYSDTTIYHYNILQAMNELNSMKIIIDNCIEQHALAMKDLAKRKNKQNVQHDKFYKTTLLSKEQRDKATKIAEQDIHFDDFANSAYGFERAFHSFKTRDEVFLEFLKFFQGKTIEKVYSHSEMPFPVLNGILQLFIKNASTIPQNAELACVVTDYMRSISRTKGFNLVKNFIKKTDKVSLRSILESISQSTSLECSDLINTFC